MPPAARRHTAAGRGEWRQPRYAFGNPSGGRRRIRTEPRPPSRVQGLRGNRTAPEEHGLVPPELQRGACALLERMTDTREMLDASPTGVPLGVAEVATAIDACLNCLQTCTSCADSDLVEPDVAEMRACIALCVSCADVCDLVARTLSRPAQSDHLVVHRLLQACVRECTLCADECAS